MGDIWAFLLQTLTASGAACLLLAVKALFQDKLSPRWHFSLWGLLAVVMVLPAGQGGRYVLLNWPWLVETARSLLTGEYGALARVRLGAPLPPEGLPNGAEEWLFFLYFGGVLVILGRFLWTYLRLRLALRRGKPAGEVMTARIAAVAAEYDLSACPAVAVEGLHSAFVCGLVRPVLALPGAGEVDDKVLLHELLHLKYHDVAWGLVIGVLRCIHWCNPLLWYCADQAGNDLEALCDQRALERLEGEDRRDYGRILLAMAEERYARTPGTSSMANGGRNIRRRVEAIARFKRYPAGMGLVSGCMVVVLALPLVVGSKAAGVYEGKPQGGYGTSYERAVRMDRVAAMASARTTPCATPAGAMDTYGKAVLSGNAIYRALCAPLEEQEEILQGICRQEEIVIWPHSAWDGGWDPGLPDELDHNGGYKIYNLARTEEGAYTGLFTVPLSTHGLEAHELDTTTHALQAIRVEEREGRWVVIPQEKFYGVEHPAWDLEKALPAWTYEAQSGDFLLRVRYQNSFGINEFDRQYPMASLFGRDLPYRMVPQLNAGFAMEQNAVAEAVYLGAEEDKGNYYGIGVSCLAWDGEGERPVLTNPSYPDTLRRKYDDASDLYRMEQGGGSNDGAFWGQQSLEEGWGSPVNLSHVGSIASEEMAPPPAYAADFYLNWEKVDELTLLPAEGGLSHD